MQARRDTYFKLNTLLSHYDNEKLGLLLGDTEKSHGWGRNHIIKLGGTKVFIKRIPVTEVEYRNLFSTKNLYDLPTYYNYGVGSAGFGVFREIVTHIKTTNWVLEGAIENFPLMYHCRILPFSGQNPDVNMERHNGYVEYWNSNENIGTYLMDRINAKHEAILFLEYIPHMLGRWLGKHIDKLNVIIEEMRKTITFLRKNGVIHFDAHFANILTDGEKPYLTDFGLVLDKRFDLSEAERLFFGRHTDYDYGEFLCCLGDELHSASQRLTKAQKNRIAQAYGAEDGLQGWELTMFLLRNVQSIYDDGLMKLNENYVEQVMKYHDIILLMHDFYSDMRRNHKKDTKYPHTKLKRLLKEAGVLQ